ncbi:MAG: hypothetical protein MRERV_14c004 [Mycoplasmataceae bacterium RV_VA103A]|nr:MAG: hypothetical protein MRERV_14c004 [Mycoplasmataceae bacterium RV_VA103A]
MENTTNKERKKYEPKEYSVIGEIEDIKEKRTYPDDRKEYKPRDQYFYQVFLKNQNPAQYRVISVWKSSLEGDKEWPAEKIWNEFDKKTFRKYDGKRINFVFKKYQRYINLVRWYIIDK